MVFEAAVVGTGPSPDDPGREGYGMGYRHARAYERIDDCEVVACADVVRENAEKFADAFGLEGVYTDYLEMIDAVEPDVVSVCVPPGIHAELVVGAAETGLVDAIHCEKPMAATWAECREMARAAEDNGVKLTINHQRRFGTPFRKAKSLLDDGRIGDLRRIEVAEKNLYDAGSHLFDLANYYVDQAPAEWVLAGIDYREENKWFGAHNENQGLSQWRYEDGVYGLASTGPGEAFVGAYLRLVGTEGAIEIGVHDGPTLRVRGAGDAGWREVDTGRETIHGTTGAGLIKGAAREITSRVPGVSSDRFEPVSHLDRAIGSVVDALRTGEESELAASNALDATELIFASWESARRTGRVDLPLSIDDNPLEAMVESGRVLGEE